MPIYEDFREKKVVTVEGNKGRKKDFTISEFDCVFGREVFAQYPLTALPKIGDYRMNEELMFRVMKFVAVESAPGNWLVLDTPDLVRNHVIDDKMLRNLEREMGAHNFDFFTDGTAFAFLDGLLKIVLTKATEILITLSEPLSRTSEKAEPPSTN